jgi:hypothetical protein
MAHAKEVVMEKRIVGFAALWIAALLQAPGVAVGAPTEVAVQKATSVPFDIGIFPYADVNSHFVRPKNNLALDGIVGAAWEIEGVAISGVSGLVRGGTRGLQLTGVSGYVGGDLDGAQIAGVVSATRGAVTGFQAAGVVSYADRISGAQLGLVNVGRGPVTGLQLSGAVNYAGEITGSQMGLVNVGGKVKGLQLGLINVAEEVDGAVIGLINVVRKNGRHEIDVWTSNTAAFSVGTKLGTKHVYSILGLGLQRAGEQTSWMPTLGLGGSIPILKRGFLNIEGLVSNVNIGSEFDENTLLAQLRVAGGFRIIDGLALYAGPVFDCFRSTSGKRLSDISYTSTLATFKPGGATVDLGLGFAVGLQAL